MDKLRILLVEDEPAEVEAMMQYADTLEDVRVVAYSNSEEGALKEAQDHLPNVIILDLELRKGGGSGQSFLKTLKKLNPVPYPFVLVTTSNSSESVFKDVREFREVYIMSKSESDYSPEKVFGHLISMKEAILSEQSCRRPDSTLDVQSPSEKRKRITKRISTEMDLFGINPKMIGRPYLIDGILTVFDGERQKIVAKVAKKHGKSESSVERAMQNAINYAWNNTEQDVLERHYTARVPTEAGGPTVTAFLFYYADKLKEEYGDE